MGSVIEINPFTRVEGHGSAKLYLEGKRVERAELYLNESPRLFEALLVGRSFAEVPEIICRICSLCSTIHKVTALMAVENALGIDISQETRLTRELITCGGTIQSHALHLYCLVLPDLMKVGSVAELAQEAPELLKAGLKVKGAGNLIQETLGGRLIHPVNIALGGLGQSVGKNKLLHLKEELEEILPTCRETYRLFRTDSPLLQLAAGKELPEPNHLAVKPGLSTIYGDSFETTARRSFPVDAYHEHIAESVISGSHAKYALLEGEVPTVGALSRLNLGGSPGGEAGAIFDLVREDVIGRDIRGNNMSQAVELCYSVERALELIDRLVETGAEGTGAGKRAIEPGSGRGTAACEAPRGVLIHSYTFDEAGICTRADVITPTSLNQGAISRDLLAMARAMEGADAEVMQSALQQLIRCYDPCISCSVHLIQL